MAKLELLHHGGLVDLCKWIRFVYAPFPEPNRNVSHATLHFQKGHRRRDRGTVRVITAARGQKAADGRYCLI